jgi:hypothetical protein
MPHHISRRLLIKQYAPALGLMIYPPAIKNIFENHRKAVLKTRGVVLTVDDLSTLDWPRLASDAGLTTIGTHITPSQVAAFIHSDAGQKFIEDCKKYKLQVEHELHAMKDLLPRELFNKNPAMFRMSKEGIRTPDFNCCAHSLEGVAIIAENAVKYSEILPSTTGRYFYWMDDGAPMCYCKDCKQLSESEQALLIENAIIKTLREKIPEASLAHLAYVSKMKPPEKVKPAKGVFLEFAPIYRSWAKPLKESTAMPDINIPDNGEEIPHGKTLDLLKKNLKVFPAATAQVLEYWLDVSLQSRWQKPAKKLSWHPDVCKSDVNTYTSLGIRHITSFAAYIDADYKQAYSDLSFIKEYGQILKEYAVK